MIYYFRVVSDQSIVVLRIIHSYVILLIYKYPVSGNISETLGDINTATTGLSVLM